MIIAISEYGICNLKIVSGLCSNITQLTIAKLGPKHSTPDFSARSVIVFLSRLQTRKLVVLLTLIM